MNREELTKVFTGEELVMAISILEKYNMSIEYNIPMFSQDFLTPNLWMYFYNRFSNEVDVGIYGGFVHCERKMISFNNIYNYSFPMKILVILNKSKFRDLEHKDYLGAILALGIKREKLGDLVMKDNKCFVAVSDELVGFILNNLSSIGRNPCDISILEDIKSTPSIEFTEKVINIASLRIDAVVAALSNISRSEAVKLINSNKVLVNYSNDIDKSYDVKLNSRITIRGKGKFIVTEIIGKTKSDKLKLKVKKYT